MNIIRKLLSHGFLIFTLVVLGAAYYYRAQLFPGLVQGDAETNTATAPAVDSQSEEATGADGVAVAASEHNPPGTMGAGMPPRFRPENPEQAQEAVGQEPGMGSHYGAPPPGVETSEEPQWERPLPQEQADESSGSYRPLTLDGPHGENPPPAEATELAPGQIPPPPIEPVPQQAVPSFLPPPMPVPPTPDGTMSSMSGMGGMGGMEDMSGMEGRSAYGPVYGATPQPTPQSSVYSQALADNPDQSALNAARHAYWNGDLERAKQEYDTLLGRLPDNPDLYGELGNLHYAQGNWGAAADAYYEAGTRLVKQGRVAQAMHLLTVIRGLSKEKSESFEAFLQEQGRGDRFCYQFTLSVLLMPDCWKGIAGVEVTPGKCEGES